jgi:hypothetical protein
MAALVSKHNRLLALLASHYILVQRDNAIGVALFAALLGRFLPRLGPLRSREAASFFSFQGSFRGVAQGLDSVRGVLREARDHPG